MPWVWPKRKKNIYRDTRAPPLQIHIQLLKSKAQGVLIVGHWKWILVVSMRMQVRSLALLSGSVILHCHELWCRSKTRLMSVLPWLWLWLWPASEAPIQSLAWEFPYTTGEALKDKKKKKKKRERERIRPGPQLFEKLSGDSNEHPVLIHSMRDENSCIFCTAKIYNKIYNDE